MESSNNSRDVRIKGLAASPGIAVGRVLRLDERGRHQFYYMEVSAQQARAEVKRLREAFAEARAQVKEIRSKLKGELGGQHEYILDAHLLMLEDKHLIGEAEREIRTLRINAEWAVRNVADRVAGAYRHIRDPYLRERASDIEDIATRLLTTLSGHARLNMSTLDRDVVIVAETLWPSTIGELDLNHVLGFATDTGGLTSHSAIIARAVGLPAVVGLREVTRNAQTGDAIIVDGTAGEVLLRPAKQGIRSYIEKRERDRARRLETSDGSTEPAVTIDGVRIKLRANVELPTEVESLSLFGAEGIGLYRSEFLFLNRLPELPAEEEQYDVYRRLAEATGDDGASIRVFDLGGDKLTLEGFEDEVNPALGLRAIRLSLKAREIFQTQVRAILRANSTGHLRIVLPLISTLGEVREAKQIIDEVKEELASSGVTHNPNLPVGVMIEVPAAALMADKFAREADFLSVGTNDLIQYLLAVDRANENVAYLYQPLHPAVLRTIAHLVRVAQKAQAPLELCGEMAASPIQAVALVGLGIRTLSLAPTSIPLVRNAIRSIDLSRLRPLLSEAVKLATTAEVEALLGKHLPRQAPQFFAALSSLG